MAKLPYTLLVPPPTAEDEAWQEIERKQTEQQGLQLRHDAEDAAFDFMDRYDSIDLGGMTLRRAFEAGYRAGVYAEQRKKNGNN